MIRIRDSYRIPGQVRATWILLVVNVLSFYVSMMVIDRQATLGEWSVLHIGGVIPLDFIQSQMLPPDLNLLRPPALITVFWSMFLHGGLFHLLSNCIALYIFGPNVEARLGSGRFTMYYLTCGAAGALAHVLFNLQSQNPMIGASGAIAGLFGAYFVFFPNHFIRITLGRTYRTWRDIIIPAKVILVIWLVSELVKVIIPDPNTHVAFFTHLGGFFCGLFLAQGMAQGPKGRGGSRRAKFRVFKGGQAG